MAIYRDAFGRAASRLRSTANSTFLSQEVRDAFARMATDLDHEVENAQGKNPEMPKPVSEASHPIEYAGFQQRAKRWTAKHGVVLLDSEVDAFVRELIDV